eukprot:1921475-Alexandrium_andersonii.AAC.1
MASCVRNLSCAVPEKTSELVGSELHPARPRPGCSASLRALSPMVTTKRASGRAGGTFRGVQGGGGPPWEDL